MSQSLRPKFGELVDIGFDKLTTKGQPFEVLLLSVT